MMLVEKSLAVMKTSILIFIKLERNLRKAKRMDEILFLINTCVQGLNKENIFKQKMKEFYISEVMYYNIRKTIIDAESITMTNKKRKDSTEQNEKLKSKHTTMFVNDSLSVFGSNAVISLSKDHLGNLQPNYFSKDGMGRKSKFSSTFNRRNLERFKCSVATQDATSPERFCKSRVTEINNVQVSVEKMGVLDFLDEENAKGVLDFEQLPRPKQGAEYIFGLFKKKQFKEDSFDDVYNDSVNVEGKSALYKSLVSKKRWLDVRKSTFTYEKENQILKNRPLEVPRECKDKEDVNFLKFFFEVSNSQMLNQMENFLANYLTISQNQRASFKKSTIRRKSLQSVLSMLRKSDLQKGKAFLTDSENEKMMLSPIKSQNDFKASRFKRMTGRLTIRHNRFRRENFMCRNEKRSRSLYLLNCQKEFPKYSSF